MSKNIAIAWTRGKKKISQNGDCLKKKFVFALFFIKLKFFLNSKNQNFYIILLRTIEGYIKKVHAKF